MGYHVKVDLTSLGAYDQLSPAVVGAIQDSMSASLAIIRDHWVAEVQRQLHSTRPLYLMGLSVDSVVYPYNGDVFTGVVQLHGKLPNTIEQGTPAFDQKIGFSKSERRTLKKGGGWYLTIPIRHSTPNSFMYGSPMPKDVYSQAKKLQDGQSLKIKGAGDTSWNGYQHKTPRYDGLTRIIKQYSNTKQSQYVTFRRVSDKSDPKSWWHKGFKGIRVAEKILPYAETTFMEMLSLNLNGLA